MMDPVTLTTSGNNCTLSNGILTLSWKEDGTIGSITRNGVELVCNTPERSDTDGATVFYVDYHAEGAFRKYRTPHLKVITANGQMAHIAYVDATGLLAIEYHIILMQGESGYYSYVIGANNTDTEFELAEFRIVYRCGNRVFDHAYNNERHGLQPTKKYMEQYEKLFDETYRLPDGEKYTNGDVYSKYDYAGYFSKNPAWGQYGHGYGFFLIPVSTEYYPGGPMKQELLVHYNGIVLNYFTGSHFGSGPLRVPIGWKKFYGPFYQYFNEGDDPEALYQDALTVAAAEQAKWPYQWVDDPLYPLVRSQVKGRLLFTDGTPCRNATVILGKPGLNIERQSADYIYYTTTDAEGNFTLKNVRFGTYSLYAYQTYASTFQVADALRDNALGASKMGTPASSSEHADADTEACTSAYPEKAHDTTPTERLDAQTVQARTPSSYQSDGCNTEQLQLDGIVISAPEQTLPDIAWELPKARVLWQLGKATRTCGGYRYGGELRNYKWSHMVPETLHFTIGSSREAEDWYYAQTKPGNWHLHFRLDTVPTSPCELIIAIAGAKGGLLQVFLNGEDEAHLLDQAYLVNDGAIYRSATLSGRYRRIIIPVAPEQLKMGENTVILHNQDGMVMYDTILMSEKM